MAPPSIGILTIGQTPRADLMDPLEYLRAVYDLQPRGALDALDVSDLPDASAATYPLVTCMRDGTRVTVDEAFLAPLLQDVLDQVEHEGVVASLLLCAGPFAALTSTRPLIRPFQLGVHTLRSLGMLTIGVVVPTDGQYTPARRKWTEAGFSPVLWSMEAQPQADALEYWLAAQVAAHPDLSALVFDYVGYPRDVLQRVQAQLGLPVIDLGHLAIAALEAIGGG